MTLVAQKQRVFEKSQTPHSGQAYAGATAYSRSSSACQGTIAVCKVVFASQCMIADSYSLPGEERVIICVFMQCLWCL